MHRAEGIPSSSSNSNLPLHLCLHYTAFSLPPLLPHSLLFTLITNTYPKPVTFTVAQAIPHPTPTNLHCRWKQF